jgi:hypothetical protein
MVSKSLILLQCLAVVALASPSGRVQWIEEEEEGSDHLSPIDNFVDPEGTHKLQRGQLNKQIWVQGRAASIYERKKYTWVGFFSCVRT